LKQVCAVQTGGMHAHEHAVSGGLKGALNFADFQPFDAAVRDNDNRAHYPFNSSHVE
jgi:hypothetical protein